MTLLRSTGFEEPDDSIYSSGECHIHAIAAARLHKSDKQAFLVIFDHEHIYWNNGDALSNDVMAVIHVYSLHQIQGRMIARDVFGDRPECDAEEECAELFELNAPYSCKFTFDELMNMTQDSEVNGDYEKPLKAVREELVLDAMNESSVKASFVNMEQEPEP